MLTQERLKELLNYDPKTGMFTWECSVGCAKKDDSAGNTGNHGYIRIRLDGVEYLAHRLVFLYTLGYLPEHGVDHINRVKTDNFFKNLREVSQTCNMRNTGNPINNNSGIKGVTLCRKSRKWKSQIFIKYKCITLGRVEDFTEAVCLRLAAEQAEDWDGCDDSSPAFQYVQSYLNRI